MAPWPYFPMPFFLTSCLFRWLGRLLPWSVLSLLQDQEALIRARMKASSAAKQFSTMYAGVWSPLQVHPFRICFLQLVRSTKMHSTRVLESGQSLTELLRSATEVHIGQVFLARTSSSFVFFFFFPALLCWLVQLGLTCSVVSQEFGTAFRGRGSLQPPSRLLGHL